MSIAKHALSVLLCTLAAGTSQAADAESIKQLSVPHVAVGAVATFLVSLPPHDADGQRYRHTVDVMPAGHEIGMRLFDVSCPQDYDGVTSTDSHFVICERDASTPHTGGEMTVHVRNLSATPGVIGVHNGLKTQHWLQSESGMSTYTDSLELVSTQAGR